MKATPLLISWHDDNAPVYSVHFDHRGRLATAGNDNNVRLWKIEATGEERKITYLSTLLKHTQAVNVVRFCPKGEMLASAGDDGNVLLWVPSELQNSRFGDEKSDDKESWRVKHMCRSSGAEIYDLAWSPDGVFFITGSMDNVARIYNAQTGQMVRQIAEHSHYVQGVAWDPLNEYVATQSSDRSVHIYTLKTKDGQFTLTSHGKFLKMDLPGRRISSNSPAPPEMGFRNHSTTSNSVAVSSPGPSAPGTPMTGLLPMDPPPVSISRRSSFGSSPSIRRSASPAPSMPLPAVKPLDVQSPGYFGGLGVKNASLYANETFTSFFRRLTFAPDGSLLFTPAGQYKIPTHGDPSKSAEEVINTVYIYTRARFNRPPVAHLPGHKKPSVAVRCSPTFYCLRQGVKPTRHITLDTSSVEDSFASLPDSVVPPSLPAPTSTSMNPPRLTTPSSATSEIPRTLPSPKTQESEPTTTGQPPLPAFSLPYRIVYAVATQDAVLVYDTQQQTPLCVVSNLHFATFTDLTWSPDGLTLIMSSSDGFCSTLAFSPGELGQVYSIDKHHHSISASTTPIQTPGVAASPDIAKPNPIFPGPASPANSITMSSSQTNSGVVNNPTPTLSSVPSVTATNSAPPPPLSFTTPPQTPMTGISHSARSSVSGSILGKRDLGAISESEKEEPKDKEQSAPQPETDDSASRAPKRKRIAPTLISSNNTASHASSESKDKPTES